MDDTNIPTPNTFFVEVSGAGIPEVDGLFVPSTAPPTKSESGTVSAPGYWNGRMAWDRADGKSARSPALSYSNSYKSWRICRLDGHLAYDATCDDIMPPTDREWHVYKKGVAPAPKVVVHHCDPRLPCPEPNIVSVIGGPGSGKGTMCELAELQLGWIHLSIGELLRAERDRGGETATIIHKAITSGKLVPDKIVVALIEEEMERRTRVTGKNNFLLDGFPRSLSNLEAWKKSPLSEVELPKMVYFECSYSVLEKRILARAKYSGRSDDNLESVKRRFETFKAETLPAVDFFESKNKCVTIDSSQERQAVFAQFTSDLSEFTNSGSEESPLTERSEILLGLRPYGSR